MGVVQKESNMVTPGEKYNMLTALAPSDKRCSEGVLWLCRCDCGNTCYVSAKSLRNGNTKSCGCLKHRTKDLTGQRFGRLIAVAPTDARRQGSVMWRCQCDCGGAVCVAAKDLISGNTKSCGCLQADAGLYNGSHHADAVDGTRASSLNRAMSKNNKSGYKGVSFNKQKQDWEAYIKFRGHHYHLGHYKNIEDAVKARARAESMHEDFLDWYNNACLKETLATNNSNQVDPR